MASSRSTERALDLGTEIDDFRIERVLGCSRRAVVYEATQLSLGRRVALKVLPAGAEPAVAPRWPEHRNAVSLYAAGTERGHRFLAMQLVPGPTLAERLDRGDLDREAAATILRDVAAVLDALHRAGGAHGAVHANNVLIDADGHALLSDFGAAGAATAAADRAAFAGLEAAVSASRRPGRRFAPVALAGLVVVAAGAAALLVLPGDEPAAAPPVLRGTEPMGSDVAAGDARSVDCTGGPPSGASVACTVAQVRLGGRAVAVPRSGVVRRWVVRAARGDLALQVLRPLGTRFDSVARSVYEHVPDGGVHAFRTNLPVRRGDLVGLVVTPGAAVGVRPGARGAATGRWLGPLSATPRAPEGPPGSGFDHELLLRVEHQPGARWQVPGRLTGRTAAAALPGRRVATAELAGGRRLVLVRLGDRVALDLFAGTRRSSRVPVDGADPRGAPLGLAVLTRPVARVEWRNRAGRIVSHDYGIGAATLTPRS